MPKLAHLPIAIILFLPFVDAQATTYKCLEGRKVTYANMPCEELGLTSVGPVKNKVSVMPATPVAKSSPTDSGKQDQPVEQDTAKNDSDDGRIPKDTGIKPVNPLVKKMLDM